MSSGSYDIGYKKPPRDKQWKKGQCGNPGRVRSVVTKTVLQMIKEKFARRETIIENGVRRHVTGFEVITRQLLTNGAKGSVRSMNVFLKYQKYAMKCGQDQAIEICVIPNPNEIDSRKNPKG